MPVVKKDNWVWLIGARSVQTERIGGGGPENGRKTRILGSKKAGSGGAR